MNQRTETPDETLAALRRRAAAGTTTVPDELTNEEKELISEETLRELGLL